MSDEVEIELVRAYRSSVERFSYFMLAGAGAALAFAITRTHDQSLRCEHFLLGVGIGAWGLSFYCGCKHLTSVNAAILENIGLVQTQRSGHLLGVPYEKIEEVSVARRSSINKLSNSANQWGNWQFRLILIGAAFYISWHAHQMYLRIPILQY